jgi:non-specific serine/threonine protein kinase
LESTREYAREKLVDAGEHDAVSRAHASAYLALAERFDRNWPVTPNHAWRAQAKPELENWRAALEWALAARGDVRLGQQLASALHWVSLGSAREGRRWVRAAREAIDGQTEAAIAAALDLMQAQLDSTYGLYKACYTVAERALERYRELDEPLRYADAQRLAGHALVLLGRCSEGEPLLAEALAAARRLGDPKGAGLALLSLGIARDVLDDVAGARSRYAEALATATLSGNDELMASVSTSLAEAEFRDGDALTAIRVAGEAIAGYRAINHAPRAAMVLGNIAMYLVALGRYDEALSSAHEALGPLRDEQKNFAIAYTLQHVAAIAAFRPTEALEAAHDGRLRAARLMGYIDTRLTALEALSAYNEQRECDRILSALREALGVDYLVELMAEGREWTEDQAVDQALLV